MKRSIKVLLVVMTITGAVGAGIAHAFPPGGAHGCLHGPRAMGFGGHKGYGDPDRMIDRMAESLNLSKEQRDAMRTIVDKARPQTRELRDKLAENHKQLRALMQQGTPKESEVRKLADAQGRAIADMIVLRTKVQTEIRGVLTDEQREKLQQWHGGRGQSSSSEEESEARHLSGADSLSSQGPTVLRLMM